jgi:cold shock CspA family protein
MIDGIVRAWFADRGFGYLRDNRTGNDCWFHKTDFNDNIEQLAKSVRVRYETAEYVQKGETRTKAVNITFATPVEEPQIIKSVSYAESAPGPHATPTALKALSTDTSSRAEFQQSNAKHVAALVDARPRGSQLKSSPVKADDGSAQ